jgi:O-glycosyl hydrolase
VRLVPVYAHRVLYLSTIVTMLMLGMLCSWLLLGASAVKVNTYVTAFNSSHRLSPQLDVNMTAVSMEDVETVAGVHSFQINSHVQFQSIEGFGGAFTQASAINILKMTAAAQDEILESYFGSSGIGYSLGRVAIGSCDFSESKPRHISWTRLCFFISDHA